MGDPTPFVQLGLGALPMLHDHYDKVWDPVKHRYKKIRGQIPPEDKHIHDREIMDEKGLILRRRRDVGSDEEIVEVVRHKGEVLPRRPGANRRSSSMDGGRNRRSRRDRRDEASDSEGSVPPRSRVRAKSTSGRSRRRGSSTSSETSLGSSTDEAKQCRKMQRKKWLTAGLASVATVHAASKIYSSIENHDKRMEEVREGKMSPEDAHRKARAARWQDAAAIAIAALGIQGAISEWNEVSEEHKEHKELLEKQAENHKRRLEHERRQRARDKHGYYKGRDGKWYHDGEEPQYSESRNGSRSGTSRYDDRRMIEDAPRDSKPRSEVRMIEDAPREYKYRDNDIDRRGSRYRSDSVRIDRDRDRDYSR